MKIYQGTIGDIEKMRNSIANAGSGSSTMDKYKSLLNNKNGNR